MWRTIVAFVLVLTSLGLSASPVTAAGTWTSKTLMPAARSLAAAAVINDVLYVAGGHDGVTGGTTTLQAYNPTTNTWSTLAAMPGRRYAGDGAGVINGELYVAGGWNYPDSGIPQSSLFVYNPGTNSWSSKASMPTLSGNGASGVINGKLYVTTAANGYSGYRNFLHVYDPGTNSWSSLASSPNAHASPAFGVINNKLYVAGGSDANDTPSDKLDIYDPATNTWSTKASMPAAGSWFASGVINGKLYAIGGTSSGSSFTSVYVYDPASDTWTTETSMPTARFGAVAGVINGVIYVAGGSTSTGTLATVEAFTTTAPAPAVLVAYWTFDSDTTNDTVGSNHGTIVGSGVTFTTGKVGRAISFSGSSLGMQISNQYVEIPSLNLPAITVEAWVNSSYFGYYTSMVTKSYYPDAWNSPWNVWSLWFSENTPNPGFSPFVASPDPAALGQWIHLAGTHDGVTAKLYVNGVEKASVPVSGPLPSTSGKIYIGPPKASNHGYQGLIDEVAIWDHALSATDIQQHYQNGLNGQGYLPPAAVPPIVTTDNATNITTNSAQLNGTLTSLGTATSVNASFQWGLTSGNYTSETSFGTMTATGPFDFNLTGLNAGTTYYFRAKAVGDGTSYGDERSFTTTTTTHTITASAGANGSISPAGAVVVSQGASQSFTLTPNTGYHIADVLVGGSSVGAVATYTFTNVTANHTIAASFAINTYTITASAAANGTISPAGVVSVNYGASQAFTITPDTGYHIADVLVDGASVGAVTSYTFSNITANRTIAASFAITNQPPTQPSNLSPGNGATNVSLTLTLFSSSFADPDTGDTHLATQWQITTTSGNYVSPVFDSGTDIANKTIITVPSGALNYSTTYYWRVRHQDNHGVWSGYSSETSFITLAQTTPPPPPPPTSGRRSLPDPSTLAMVGSGLAAGLFYIGLSRLRRRLNRS